MRGLWAVLAVALAGCRSGTDANLVDISGHWQFTEILEDRLHGFSCADTGAYEIEQSADRFIGRYGQRGVCQTPAGPVNNADSGTVQGGQVLGRTIRFMVTAACQYDGSASGIPTTALEGHGFCAIQDANRTIELRGSWRARR
jgi:hypothetical protein